MMKLLKIWKESLLRQVLLRISRLGRYTIYLIIKAYQICLAPLFTPACRFYPSCSHYTQEAVMRYGVTKGIWLGLKRVSRCHPYNEGGYDPLR